MANLHIKTFTKSLRHTLHVFTESMHTKFYMRNGLTICRKKRYWQGDPNFFILFLQNHVNIGTDVSLSPNPESSWHINLTFKIKSGAINPITRWTYATLLSCLGNLPSEGTIDLCSIWSAGTQDILLLGQRTVVGQWILAVCSSKYHFGMSPFPPKNDRINILSSSCSSNGQTCSSLQTKG